MNATTLTPEDLCRQHQASIHPMRIFWCARCGHATGGGYGHLQSSCLVDTRFMNDPHLCCPGSCARLDGPISPIAPCHPAPDDRARWAVDAGAERDRQLCGDRKAVQQ